jgi:hypothetical protein
MPQLFILPNGGKQAFLAVIGQTYGASNLCFGKF